MGTVVLVATATCPTDGLECQQTAICAANIGYGAQHKGNPGLSVGAGPTPLVAPNLRPVISDLLEVRLEGPFRRIRHD